MYQVILQRMPHKPDRVWTHSDLRDARRQAEALAYLHRVEPIIESFGFIIDARHFYAPKKKP